MKNLVHVFNFELGNYFKSKGFVLSTVLISLAAVVLLSIPGILSGAAFADDEDETSIAICDSGSLLANDTDALEKAGFGKVQKCVSEDEVRELVKTEKADKGIVICSDSSFHYYVFNKELGDETVEVFTKLLSEASKRKFCKEKNVDYAALKKYDVEAIQSGEYVLGKDSNTNYGYSYALVMIVFMIVIMYGMMIANSVANEKSNRTVELLVTSTSSTSLLFGKVLAATLAILCQVSLIFTSILGAYHFNKEHLGDMVSMFLDIPSQVLICFAVFGLGGFLLYAFMYGALGALVSKIEDLNKSAGTAQMLVMVIYFLTLFQMQEPDGIVIKILSYLPVSSYSAMFIRIAMGNVEVWEIVLSTVILYLSVIGMGILSAKIFRNSTLRYGNPISIARALRELKGQNYSVKER